MDGSLVVGGGAAWLPGGRTGPSGEWLGRSGRRAGAPAFARLSIEVCARRGRPALSSPAGPVRPPDVLAVVRGSLLSEEEGNGRGSSADSRLGGTTLVYLARPKRGNGEAGGSRNLRRLRDDAAKRASTAHPRRDRRHQPPPHRQRLIAPPRGPAKAEARLRSPATPRPHHFRASASRDRHGVYAQVPSRRWTLEGVIPIPREAAAQPERVVGRADGPRRRTQRRPAPERANLGTQAREGWRARRAPRPAEPFAGGARSPARHERLRPWLRPC